MNNEIMNRTICNKVCKLASRVNEKLFIFKFTLTDVQLNKILHSFAHVKTIEFDHCKISFQNKIFRISARTHFLLKMIKITH